MTDPNAPRESGTPAPAPIEGGEYVEKLPDDPKPAVPAPGTPKQPIDAVRKPPAESHRAQPRSKRTSEQIRADIDAQRAELGQSVDQLRDRVTELTDWRSQLKKHRKQIIIGAVATGFVVGGLMALRRR